MRRAVRPVERGLVRIGKLEDVVRGAAVVAGLVRPVPALAVLETFGRIAVERTRNELLKVRRLHPRQRSRTLDHRAGVLVLAEAVHVVLGNDPERTHLLLADVVRIAVGHENVRIGRELLRARASDAGLVEVAPESVRNTADEERMFFVRVVAVLLAIVLPVDRRVGREGRTRGRNVEGDLRQLEFVQVIAVLNILDARRHPPGGVRRRFVFAPVDRLHRQCNVAMGAMAGGVEKASILHRAALGGLDAERFEFLRRAVVLEDEVAGRSALLVAVEVQLLGAARLAPETEIMDRPEIRHAGIHLTYIRLEDVRGILRHVDCALGTLTLPDQVVVEIIAPNAVFRADERNRHAADRMVPLRRKLGILGREDIFLFAARVSGPGRLADAVQIEVAGIVHANFQVGIGGDGVVLPTAVEGDQWNLVAAIVAVKSLMRNSRLEREIGGDARRVAGTGKRGDDTRIGMGGIQPLRIEPERVDDATGIMVVHRIAGAA